MDEVHPTESLILQQPILILTELTQNHRNLLNHKMHCLLSQPECDTMLGLLVLHHHHSSSSCSSDEENSLIAPDKIPTTTWLTTLGEMQIFSKSDIYVHGKNEMVKVAKNVREGGDSETEELM
jgi:ABC-type thiamine transport system ATPase subunit